MTLAEQVADSIKFMPADATPDQIIAAVKELVAISEPTEIFTVVGTKAGLYVRVAGTDVSYPWKSVNEGDQLSWAEICVNGVPKMVARP